MKINTIFLSSIRIFAKLLSYSSITLYAVFIFGSAAFFLLLITLVTLTSARGLFL
jgi:hypothetical protein